MSSFATIKPEHNGRCTRKRMAVFRSWLIQAAMTSLFHRRYFFLFPKRICVQARKQSPFSDFGCVQTLHPRLRID